MSFQRYPKYAESGIDWLGLVPEHWAVRRLRLVAEINPSKAEASTLDTGMSVSFLPMEAIGDDGSLSLERVRIVADLEGGYTYFREGDVTLAKITPCFENGKGAVMRGLVNGIGFGTTELIVARPRPKALLSDYLHYVFTSTQFRALGESQMYGAGGQKRVPESFVRDFRTAFPPLEEQSSIVRFLDRETAKIDALIAEQQRLMELLQEKRQAVISHAVTKGLSPDAPMKPSGVEWLGDVPAHWEIGPVKRYCESLNHRRIPLNTEERSTRSGEYPYYGASGVIDFVDDFLFEESLVLVSEDGANLLSRATPIAFAAHGKYWVNNHAHILRPQDGCVAFWAERLEAIDLTPFVTGAAQPKLTSEAIMNLLVAVPPAVGERQELQQYVVSKMSKSAVLEQPVQQAMALLYERRSALITAAVTGQIDVRGSISAEAA